MKVITIKFGLAQLCGLCKTIECNFDLLLFVTESINLVTNRKFLKSKCICISTVNDDNFPLTFPIVKRKIFVCNVRNYLISRTSYTWVGHWLLLILNPLTFWVRWYNFSFLNFLMNVLSFSLLDILASLTIVRTAFRTVRSSIN